MKAKVADLEELVSDKDEIIQKHKDHVVKL